MPKLSIDSLFPKTKEQEIGSDEIESFENEDGSIEEDLNVIRNIDVTVRSAALTITGPWNPVLHPLSQKFYKALDEVGELHKVKGADYGSAEDPFLNVREGEEFGIEPWKSAMNRANDKMVRIKRYAKTGTLENESVRDSFLDLANYALIALVLWEEANGD